MSKAKRIIIARHGQRLDHVDPNWVEDKSVHRPQDPPLHDAGHEMARQLGQYLLSHPVPVNAADVVIYCSPLIRCVETARGIAEGLGNPDIPIHIEESLVEGGFWIQKDLMRKPSVIEEGRFLPLWHAPEVLRGNVWDRIVLSERAPFARARIRVDDRGRISEHPNVEDRCAEAASRLVRANHDRSTVLLVGHGCTTMKFAHALRCKVGAAPYYTSFVDLHQTEGSLHYEPYGEVFGTPHLSFTQPNK